MINLSRRDLVTLGVVALLMIALGFAIGTAVTPTAQLPQNCTAGQILSWDGSAWTCAGTVVVDNTGNVGIGTTAPRGHFDVDGAGDIWLTDDGLQSGGQSLYLPGHIYMAPFGNGDVVYLQARRRDNSGTTALQLRTYDNGTLKEAVHIAGDGDVGIGTNTPGAKLDVDGMIHTTEGFAFQDGTVQSTAVQIEAGRVHLHDWTQSPNLVQNVSFLNDFIEQPTVVVSLARIDADKNANLRIEVWATDVTPKGFKLRAKTWFDTRIYNATVSWIAFGG